MKKVEADNLQAADAQKKASQFESEAEKKLRQSRQEAHDLAARASAEANKNIDKFDKEVTEGAAKAKSGISSWFK